MKRFLLTLLTFAVVVAFIALALMPAAFRQYRLWEGAEVVTRYRGVTARLSPSECEAMLARAQAWNEAQADGGDEYVSLLNPAGDGVMAILELPKLGTALAVYHGNGTEASVSRVTHRADSLLPTGSAAGPCVLSASKDRFFDPFAGLDRLIPGDCFFVHVLDKTLTYEVSQVEAASTGDPEDFQGDGNEDECVLVAAASGAQGEPRLAVRGRRVSRRNAKPADDSRSLPTGVSELVFGLPVAAAGLFLLMAVEWLRRSARRRKRRRMKL